MGNSQSNSTNPRFDLAKRAFTERKLEDLKSLFDSLAAQSQSNGKYVSSSVFKAYIGVEGPLCDRMFDLVTQKRKDQKLTYEDLVIAKARASILLPLGIEEYRKDSHIMQGCGAFTANTAKSVFTGSPKPHATSWCENKYVWWGTYEKGTNADIEEFIYQLLDVFDDGVVGRSDLEAVLTAVLRNISSHESHQSEPSPDREILDIFLNAANLTTDDTKCAESCMSFEEFRSWCARLPSVRKFLGTLLSTRDSGHCIILMAHCTLLLRCATLVHPCSVLTCMCGFPYLNLQAFLHTLHAHVASPSVIQVLTPYLNCRNDKGPTLLVIKDKEGYIYGGYASQPWEKHADFYGDMKSFLFQLYPKASVYRPTGANSNLQWCAIHFSSESIPNGIGFGGRAHHFGLFISANFDQGHTFTCTTFGSPSLSKTHQIYPEVIECWGVAIKRAQDNQDRLQGTVLERFKEDRHMLNMVGLANSSE
ncbi:hypothetical protein EJD97_006743 [Solanum chilense]|uniref:TLDc domain-containing protein n=1 Tax=Solanum chilense TaxID=4083 RepID=A0A6N2BQC8_SOLCI|nr:hypothetical protein EJD97_006743 [Solanum chilense]